MIGSKSHTKADKRIQLSSGFMISAPDSYTSRLQGNFINWFTVHIECTQRNEKSSFVKKINLGTPQYYNIIPKV